MRNNQRQDNASISRVTWIGLYSNLGLAAVKLSAGVWAGSLALTADGLHSLADTVTDLAVIFGVYFGGKEPDYTHPYGHGRIETFAAVFVAIALFLAGAGMMYKAGGDIAAIHAVPEKGPTTLNAAVIAVALLSLGTKEVLYRWARRIAVTTHSTALYANAWHHRSDSLSSVAVLIGVVAVRLGYPYGDPLAALAVSLMIVMVAIRIIGDCFHELSERAVDRSTLRQIEQVLGSDGRICQWHRLRTRTVGREIFVDVHILVNPELNITEAHQIADTLENNLHHQIPRPINVVVHIEPDVPELRQ